MDKRLKNNLINVDTKLLDMDKQLKENIPDLFREQNQKLHIVENKFAHT